VWCERGCIQLPDPCDENANWYTRFLDPHKGQLWLFPNAAHDDLTDTFVIGIQYLENLIAAGYNARQRAAQEEEQWIYGPRFDSNGVQREGRVRILQRDGA